MFSGPVAPDIITRKLVVSVSCVSQTALAQPIAQHLTDRGQRLSDACHLFADAVESFAHHAGQLLAFAVTGGDQGVQRFFEGSERSLIHIYEPTRPY